ncbi:hypothetical protein HDU79_008719 [Rhizoclosmatium sp. JEL0117]|nr:hypothetical protein HDU79_008719 [Rhizoclosmatium sp. JEL0117]
MKCSLISLATVFATLTSARPVLLDERDAPLISSGWTVCGGYADVKQIIVSSYDAPNPIVVQYTGNTITALNNGIVDFAYTLFLPTGKRLFSDDREYDLCTLAGIQCPIQTGSVSFQIPTPSQSKSKIGLVSNATITVTDGSNKQFLCLNNPSYAV